MSNHDWIRVIGQKFQERYHTQFWGCIMPNKVKNQKAYMKEYSDPAKRMRVHHSWDENVCIVISPLNNSPVWVHWLWYRIDKVKANLHFTPQYKQSPRERDKRVGGRLLSKGHSYCQTLWKLLFIIFAFVLYMKETPVSVLSRPKNKKRIKAPTTPLLVLRGL